MYRTKEKQILKRYKELTHFIKDQNDIKTMLLCMYQLTPTWFEHYIAWYLKEVERYNQVTVNWWIHDMGFDVVCRKHDHYAVVQCKKYETQHIAVKDILYFDWCIKKILPRQQQNLQRYYITTNRCNPQSKEVAKELWIHLWDYRKIIHDIQKHYPIEQFLHIHKNNSKLVVQKYVLKWLNKELLDSSSYVVIKKQLNPISQSKALSYA